MMLRIYNLKEVFKEIRRRGLKVSVAGIPKTIDNDIDVIDRSFGCRRGEAQRAINAAHVEAESIHNGFGLVKLVGRYSGHIAMSATLASRDVDCCLIPEVPFYLEGEGDLYEYIERQLHENKHVVIVVAEGAGQDLMIENGAAPSKCDASGNKQLLDVGLWLSTEIEDPTYMIRAIPSNAADNIYCTLLAQSAINGAMAGYSGFTVGPVNGRHAYIPTSVKRNNHRESQVRMWARLLSSTNQPDFMRHEEVENAGDRSQERYPIACLGIQPHVKISLTSCVL
ncbi:hypothetical protein L7F22_067770 [Adiantum nelumboides]|nr:hypothetical protein [Adiantum nelumboides]